MGGRDVASVERPRQAGPRDSVFLPGGAFRMASDKHYPEEAPVHRVVVGGFWIDRTPVTNRQFKEFHRPQDVRGSSARPEELSRRAAGSTGHGEPLGGDL